MPYRTFADDRGRSWEIWDVRLERVERRGTERRGGNGSWDGPERRVAPDRRQRMESRLRLTHPLGEGWLVFKSTEEKRRLTPIPPGWDQCEGSELRELWERADVIVPGMDEQSI